MIAEAVAPFSHVDPFLDRNEDRWAVRFEPVLSAKRQPGILVVDDDIAVRTMLNIGLSKHGFAVWLAADGYQALQVYRIHRDEIDLALIDVRMPRFDGPRTLAALQQLNPTVRICFMTGDPGRHTEDDLIQRGVECIIHKPFHLEQVARLVEGLLGPSAALPRLSQTETDCRRSKERH